MLFTPDNHSSHGSLTRRMLCRSGLVVALVIAVVGVVGALDKYQGDQRCGYEAVIIK